MSYELRIKGSRSIGLIGYGNFGQVICQYLFPKNTIFLYTSKKDIPDLPQHISIIQSLKQFVQQSDIIIPTVPIRNFESVIKQLAPFVKPNQIIMDVCSVKEYAVGIMKKHLPEITQIIASHPMFGPNSLKQTQGNVHGFPFVLWNVSAEKIQYDEIKNYLSALKLTIIELSPDKHDFLSAHSQFFTMLIGEMVHALQLQSTTIDTPGTRKLFEAMKYAGTQKHIIEDMIRYNRYCKPMLQKMTETLDSFNKRKK